jgi:hypothetical protein
MGGDLKYGAAHEPAISPAYFIGGLWLFGAVCDADHGSAVAHPDIGDHAPAATELNAGDVAVAIGALTFPMLMFRCARPPPQLLRKPCLLT